MAREAPEIRLIRETLEGVMHPSTASSVFFEALQAGGGSLPDDARAAVELVNGPLRSGLADRLGKDAGDTIADQLAELLSRVGREVRKRPSRHDQQTRAISLSNDTLPVFVLTASRQLVDRLHAALGPIMSPVIVTDSEVLRIRLTQIKPAFVLVDASEFPAIEPDDLVSQVSMLESGVIRAVWGSDLPYGQGVMDAALKRGCPITTFDRREGVEPLIDVIRSRHS